MRAGAWAVGKIAAPARALAAASRRARARLMPFGTACAGAQKLSIASLRREPGMEQKIADIEDLSGPEGLVRLLHTTAVQRGLHSYVDPATGWAASAIALPYTRQTSTIL